MKRLILPFFIFIFLALSIMSPAVTIINRYVDTNNGTDTGGSTGCAGTGASACRSLNYVLVQNEQNLVTNTSSLVISAVGTATDTYAAALTITGYTTSTTYTVTINGNNTLPYWNTNAYNLSVGTIDDEAIYVNISNIIINGLQVQNTTGSHSSDSAIYGNAGNGNITVSNCIIRSNGSATGDGIHFTFNETTPMYFYNNIIYGFNGSGIWLGSIGAIYAYNNTMYGNTTDGFNNGNGTSTVAKNNIAYNNGTDYVGTFSSSSTNNLSKDATAPADGTYFRSTTLTFANTGSEDYALASTDTAAIGQGVNLSADANLPFNTDITGAMRTTPWDLGAVKFAYSTTTTINKATLNNAIIN